MWQDKQLTPNVEHGGGSLMIWSWLTITGPETTIKKKRFNLIQMNSGLTLVRDENQEPVQSSPVPWSVCLSIPFISSCTLATISWIGGGKQWCSLQRGCRHSFYFTAQRLGARWILLQDETTASYC